MVFFLS
ncbi:hypothetical protein D046_0168A, partial [Vibrio parahaemolyticus V-223/04]